MMERPGRDIFLTAVETFNTRPCGLRLFPFSAVTLVLIDNNEILHTKHSPRPFGGFLVMLARPRECAATE